MDYSTVDIGQVTKEGVNERIKRWNMKQDEFLSSFYQKFTYKYPDINVYILDAGGKGENSFYLTIADRSNTETYGYYNERFCSCVQEYVQKQIKIKKVKTYVCVTNDTYRPYDLTINITFRW